jgi:butyrate kinase
MDSSNALNVERVDLIVRNTPGVLERVVIHIRREGWNIKRLDVREIGGGETSRMEIDIEGAHAQLARAAERLLNLDCVERIGITRNGERFERGRPAERRSAAEREISTVGATAKPMGALRILAINPGSTSTKFAVFDDESQTLLATLRHSESELALCGSVPGQKDLRESAILKYLNESGVPLDSLDAVVGRGGLLKPIESGTYIINERMLDDLRSAAASIHASALGAIIAAAIARNMSIPAYVTDPIVVDEMDRNAKLTGLPGIERVSVFHALNQKAVARRLADRLGKPYENARLVVAHLGGGITVGAHRYGRVIDVNDALAGEGPFTPERAGGIPAIPLIRMCFSGEYTQDELIRKLTRAGGMQAYLGTNDLRAAQKMINDGDEFAALVLDSMAYQVSKEIGSMVAVLEGSVDAIILTGGLAHSNRFTGAIKQRVDKFAAVSVFPGEDEMLALMQGALRVLRGQEDAAWYE